MDFHIQCETSENRPVESTLIMVYTRDKGLTKFYPILILRVGRVVTSTVIMNWNEQCLVDRQLLVNQTSFDKFFGHGLKLSEDILFAAFFDFCFNYVQL